MKLEAGQVAVVTGAASGIGFAIATALGQRGLAVALADIEAKALDQASRRLQAEGIDAQPFVCDVADASAVETLAAAVMARFGRVDLLVNNAGVGGFLGPLWDSHPNDWSWAFGVNVFGVVNGLRAFLPRMLAGKGGHVVNVASLAGLTAPPFLSTYVATKHAVVGLSESLKQELAAIGSGIKVSVVCPGVVQSRIADSERNRPADLAAAVKTPAALLDRIRAAFAQAMADPMPTDELARRVLAGIERDDFLILTHPDQNPQILQRLVSIEQSVGRNPPAAGH
ncbi:MAG: SDR family NAD(P)-dependent oxidoreductase [Rhodopseudomonas sp.]|uniref:SDR family NAD(P)-dependent oxidoreductase n=1 Tax=Rhodopseudomonas sp. TaxID=1078 RepID=UPI0017F5C82E|nr:SDR family NAD(P)-dependent oxidoreductase [Rhodopseudomonas sp.]NVN87585.1 SDR family NAD(P)-dependent oxidoreductase [Rhodopseudomonas sp.]